MDYLGLKKFTKFFRRNSCITHNSAKRKGINRIVTRNGKNARTVGHDNVLALAYNGEARFLKSANCGEMINAGNLWQD